MKSFFTSFATTLCITAIAAAQSFTPNDPFFTPGSGAGASENYFGQWYLRNQMPINAGNTGVDVNVIGAWQRGLTGAGVTIGIVDSGFEGDHPDVVQNFRNEFSWSFELSVAQNQAMLLRGAPVTTLAADSHGMSVAGIAGARGGNGIGITGAAPMAGLASLNFVGQSGIARHMAAILFQGQTNSAGEIDPYASVNWGSFANGAPVRVKNHSYSNRASFAATNASLDAALAESAANGVIHLFSTGNQRGALGVQDANRNSYGFTPNFIRVAALGSDGRVAAYSSFGANTFPALEPTHSSPRRRAHKDRARCSAWPPPIDKHMPVDTTEPLRRRNCCKAKMATTRRSSPAHRRPLQWWPASWRWACRPIQIWTCAWPNTFWHAPAVRWMRMTDHGSPMPPD